MINKWCNACLINEFEVVRFSGEEYALKRSGFEVVVNDCEFLVSVCLKIEKFICEGVNV